MGPNAPSPSKLMWFRDDLRLADNPALLAACGDGAPVTLLYVLEDSQGVRPLGGAARWWLHHSLVDLSESVKRLGASLVLRRGDPTKVVVETARQVGATRVHCNRRYGPASGVDALVARELERAGIAVESHKANLIVEPDEIVSKSGTPFQVYSAFWRAALTRWEPHDPLGPPKTLRPAAVQAESEAIESYSLLPRAPDWSGGIRATWTPGESSARARLDEFVERRLSNYPTAREYPGGDGSSMLSPYLRFGEISPTQVWHIASRPGQSAAKFLSEIGWREFAFHLLGQFRGLAEHNLKPAFDSFPWQRDADAAVRAWQRGWTGYPIVDAGMRQLWQTGWMHNRVRMITASFLTKHLLADWRLGEEWFWDTLVDADVASNPANWQWVAGSGADAQPYFRIFNPVLQGEKFDPKGAYVRKYVPEIADLPDRCLHKPWQASPIELASAGIVLGETYPAPIVDHPTARVRALEAFDEMKRLSAAKTPRAPR